MCIRDSNVTDTAFLGHVSEVALGASAMGGLFYICAVSYTHLEQAIAGATKKVAADKLKEERKEEQKKKLLDRTYLQQ